MKKNGEISSFALVVDIKVCGIFTTSIHHKCLPWPDRFSVVRRPIINVGTDRLALNDSTESSCGCFQKIWRQVLNGWTTLWICPLLFTFQNSDSCSSANPKKIRNRNPRAKRWHGRYSCWPQWTHFVTGGICRNRQNRRVTIIAKLLEGGKGDGRGDKHCEW